MIFRALPLLLCVGCINWSGVKADYCANHSELAECATLLATDGGYQPLPSFALSYGGSQDEGLAQLAAENTSGRFAVVGTFSGAMTFGASGVASDGGVDGYAAFISGEHQPTQIATVGSSGVDTALAVDFLNSGDVVFGGSFASPFAATTPAQAISGIGGYFAQLSEQSGAVSAARLFATPSSDPTRGRATVRAVANGVVGGDGDAGSYDLCQQSTGTFTERWGFLAGYDPTGARCSWVTTFSATLPTGEAGIFDIALADTGELYALIYARGDVNVSSGSQVLPGGTGRWFVIRVDNAGRVTAFGTYDVNGTLTSPKIAVGPNAQLWVLCERAVPSFGTNLVIAQMAFSGTTLQLAREWLVGSPGDDTAGDIAVDLAGRAWVTGRTSGKVLFDGRTTEGLGAGDILVLAVSSTESYGPFLLGGSGEEAGTAIDTRHGIAVGGVFNQALRLGTVELVSYGRFDVFVTGFAAP
ncbi:MAG: hypothetical protein ACT4TC_19910 [Myxococcaceae bacterium]